MEDADDLEVFCERTYPKLVGALDLYLGDLHVAEELAQEALVKAAKRWAKIREYDSPGGWTYRVAMNLAKSWIRRKRAEARAYARSDVDVDAPLELDQDVSDRRAVRDALQTLPETQRRAVVLRYYLGMSGPEAADALDISHAALRARLKRGIEGLREQLGAELGALDTVDIEEAHDAV
ncbi:MAG: sigma-70 family RNA polymerase sigma factor [Nitriliruptorales bacterium]|nr:sigma-70 family RNA polymerase sigma factor [Nitriliruptorales bacterium]